MNTGDIIILGLIFLAMGSIVFKSIKRRKSNADGCTGSCENCHGCSGCRR